MAEKIFIIGIVASGKTTLAKQLSLKKGIPWYELDAIVHKSTCGERIKQDPESQMHEINKIDCNGPWIFEGVYRDSYHALFEMADTIIFLDTPLWKRRCRIFFRFIKQNLKLESCDYIPNWHMLLSMYRWTNDFERDRSTFMAMLSNYEDKLLVCQNLDSLHYLV